MQHGRLVVSSLDLDSSPVSSHKEILHRSTSDKSSTPYPQVFASIEIPPAWLHDTSPQQR